MKRFKVESKEVPSGGGGVTPQHTIYDTVNGVPVSQTFRAGSDYVFLWEDHAKCMCAALNLGWESLTGEQ